MSVKIVTDSHSSVNPKIAKKLGIEILPMPFYLDGLEYFENITINQKQFYKALEEEADISTSQPSPIQVMKIWDKALEEADEVVYFPLSSGLSGACSTAMGLAADEDYAGRVFVVDNGRIAMPQYRTILDAVILAEGGFSGQEICDIMTRTREDFSIYIAVNTLEYLKKGGRVSSATAAVGSLLGIKPVLSLDVGLLQPKKNFRGMKSARRQMLNMIRQDLEGPYSDYYRRGAIHMLSAGTADAAVTKSWCAEIHEAFPDYTVQYAPLSMGICCHTGPGALGVGFTCIPQEVMDLLEKPAKGTKAWWIKNKIF